MYGLIKYGSVENIPYYNCSGKSLEYWYSTGQQRTIFGVILFIFGVFIESIYIAVIYFIFKTELIKFSCFKIMVFLGMIDVLATVISSFISGYLFIMGAVFCTNQTFIYIFGSIGTACWCAACASTTFLVINRVGGVLFPIIARSIFEGKMIYVGFGIIFIYGCITLLCPPLLFNSVLMTWIPDTLTIEPIYKTPEIKSSYRNHVQNVNNWILGVSTCTFYSIYCLLVNKMQNGQKSRASRQVFIQAAIICIFNTSAALTFNAFIFVTPPIWVSGIGEACWTLVHACPALVYISMNKVLRQEFSKFLPRRNNIHQVESYISGSRRDLKTIT